jgi:ferrous iron transport protein A
MKTSHNITKLTNLTPGQSAILENYVPHSFLARQKLLAMGLTPGVEIRVVRFAPLGDPIQILVRECALSLRKEEALLFEVRLLSKSSKEELK